MLKKIAVAMVAAGGLLVASVPAHAAGHVSLSIGLPLPPLPGVYVAPAPVYEPAYAPAYAPAYYGPPPVVYEAPAAYPYYGGYYGPRYYGYGPRVVYRGGYDHRGYDHRDHGGGWHR